MLIKGISYWSLKDAAGNPPAIDDALAIAKAARFRALELCIGHNGVITPDTSQADCESIQRAVAESGMLVKTLASGMSWSVSPTSDDPDTRKRAISNHAHALQRAAWLGCQATLFVPGLVKRPTGRTVVRYDKAVDRARDAVTQLLDVAHRVNVDLLLENVWNGLFYSPLEFADFIDSFHSDRLGIYFDVGNLLGYHQDPPGWIEILGNRIKRIHIKDFKESIGNHAGFCPLLEGDVPWQRTIQALKTSAYNDTVIAEVAAGDANFLSQTSSAMDKILAM